MSGQGLMGAALVVAVLGILCLVLAHRSRLRRGLGSGPSIARDDELLKAPELGLIGWPDRIIRKGTLLIPEEWKSARRVSRGHRLQLGTYFHLIEATYGARPPFGVVVLGDGTRVKVANTEELRAEVLAIAEEIREHRRRLLEEIPVRQPAAKCGRCGQRTHCNWGRSFA